MYSIFISYSDPPIFLCFVRANLSQFTATNEQTQVSLLFVNGAAISDLILLIDVPRVHHERVVVADSGRIRRPLREDVVVVGLSLLPLV